MNNYTIPNLVKTCEILKVLAGRPEGVTSAELEKLVRVPRTTAFRILKTLCAQEMAEKRGAFFFPGSSLMQIGLHSLQSLEIRSMSIPILSRLASETGFTAHLAIPSGFHSLILEVHDSPNPVRVASRPGSIVPLHCSSTGKVFLAWRFADRLEEYFAGASNEWYTENTIVTPARMKEEIEKIKRDGYAVDNHEFYKDVYCLAAPVRDSRGQVIAALGVTGPSVQFTDENRSGAALRVVKAARELSAVLGYSMTSN
jgi:DNA-binding IclR family transcriptional regulator